MSNFLSICMFLGDAVSKLETFAGLQITNGQALVTLSG